MICGTLDGPVTLLARLLGLAKTQTSAITRSSQTATFTSTSHGFQTGDVVTISGATQSNYNGTFVIANATADTFDFTVVGTPTTPSTGTAVANSQLSLPSGSFLTSVKQVGDRVVVVYNC